MNEIFFDRPGTLFSDGKIVKLSLQSVQPTLQGEISNDVALLVCLPEKLPALINILQEFLSHHPGQASPANDRVVSSELTQEESNIGEEKEISLLLGLSTESHF